MQYLHLVGMLVLMQWCPGPLGRSRGTRSTWTRWSPGETDHAGMDAGVLLADVLDEAEPLRRAGPHVLVAGEPQIDPGAGPRQVQHADQALRQPAHDRPDPVLHGLVEHRLHVPGATRDVLALAQLLRGDRHREVVRRRCCRCCRHRTGSPLFLPLRWWGS